VAIDPRNLKPADLAQLLNSTPLGTVIDERQLYRHRMRAGFRIGDGRRVDLLRYVAWLIEQRRRPQHVQAKAQAMLHEIWMAETRGEAEQAFDLFVSSFQAKYPKAAECLRKDREVLLTCYDFPAEHWVHLRTTNPMESAFATVRLRTRRTKGGGSRTACLTMVFKLAQSAQQHWRSLNGSTLLPEVIAGVKFTDGLKDAAA